MNKRWRAVGTLLGLAALSACSLPEHPRPPSTLQIPAGWHTSVGPGASAEAHWWQAFHDPVLNTLVSTALAHNSDLRIAAARIADYQGRLRIADAAHWPTLDAAFSPERGQVVNAFGLPQLSNVYQGQFEASYEVDLWGRLGSLSAAAKADLQGQQASADAAALSVASATASGYLTLRGLDAQLELAKVTLASRQKSLDLAQREYEVGYSSRLEVAQARAEYRSTAQNVPALERSISQQENALSLLIGNNPGPITRGASLNDLQPPPIPAGLPSQLLRRRPDIYQAEQAIVSADANLAAARDQLLPSVQLSAAFGREAFTSQDFFHDPIKIWSIGGSVLAPIFEGGRLRAQTDVAAAERDETLYSYEKIVRNAFAETEDSLSAIQRLGEQAVQVQELRNASADSLRIAHNRYQNGYDTYLNELDAQRSLFNADLSLLQVRTNALIARVNLYQAMGGGWTVTPE